ncbi:unnamed protein product, partial [Didymodactylos carnosus]
FEQGALNAFEAVFPGIDVKLCHFHFGQNIWKRIQKYGLVKLYKDKQIRQQLANILSLPLMPPDDVTGLFVDIVEEPSNLDNKFLKLTDYILKNYIEHARFPIEKWNHFDLIEERPRTNNHVEGYHQQLNAHIGIHSSTWNWIMNVQKAEEITAIRVELIP